MTDIYPYDFFKLYLYIDDLQQQPIICWSLSEVDWFLNNTVGYTSYELYGYSDKFRLHDKLAEGTKELNRGPVR